MTTNNEQTPGVSGLESRPSGEWWIDYAIWPNVSDRGRGLPFAAFINRTDNCYRVHTPKSNNAKGLYKEGDVVYIFDGAEKYYGTVKMDLPSEEPHQTLLIDFESGTPVLCP